ncbi:MAG: methyltransferase domain-containing protein [bacterium]|nr:methyltransferase domain-containing protein [bacterium]
MYKQLLVENIEGLVRFVHALATHEGVLNTHRLHKVIEQNSKLKVVLGTREEKLNNFSVGMGGEVVNSFCSLYEAGYFFQALFITAVGSAAIRNGWVARYQQGLADPTITEQIRADLMGLSSDAIFQNMCRPVIAIVSSLDTDVNPIRYNKHQLWRLPNEAFKMRVDTVTEDVYGQIPIDQTESSTYWVQEDREIAEKAMSSGEKLTYVKALQFYQVFKVICEKLKIDISQLPLYFNFVPRQEIIENGPDNSYLEALISLHSQEGKEEYRKRTGINKPWFIGVSCPNCGMGSKRVISSSLMGDNQTVKCYCREHSAIYRDESGHAIELVGCGHKWQFKVPLTKRGLWEFIRDNNITLHFAARWLICILKDTVDTPVGYVMGDIGVIRDKSNMLCKNPIQIKGYGDHRQMLTSALNMQDWLINCQTETTRSLRERGLMMPQPLILFGYDKQTTLIDPEVPVKEIPGMYASDTSFMKALRHGRKVADLFREAVRLHPFTQRELANIDDDGAENIRATTEDSKQPTRSKSEINETGGYLQPSIVSTFKQQGQYRLYHDGLVKMRFDSLTSSDKEAVLDWFDEEQGVLLEVAEKFVPHALQYSKGTICVDPGCGSSILSLAIAKKFESQFRAKVKRIVSVDINERAIEFSRDNAKQNGLADLYEFKLEPYTRTSLTDGTAALISHNVPYHPTNPKYAGSPFLSCEGGEDGQMLLRPFLEASSHHLAANGVLYGITNCRGKELPQFMDYIRQWYPEDSIFWYPIHKPCSTAGFLEYITRWQESEWAQEVARDFPLNHAGIYIIVRDGKKKFEVIDEHLKLATPDWQFRWDAHRMIQDGAIRRSIETT